MFHIAHDVVEASQSSEVHLLMSVTIFSMLKSNQKTSVQHLADFHMNNYICLFALP